MREFLLFFCIITLAGCGTITPGPVKDRQGSVDSSVPEPYDLNNSGFLTYTSDHKGALISPNARSRYNNLILKYALQFKDRYAIELEEDGGIKPVTDVYNNKVYYIDKEHLNYFLRLCQWNRDNKDADSVWLKLKSKILP